MSLTTAIAIYFIIWWVVLFAVLPFGVRSQEESGEVAPGTDPGAPAIAEPQAQARLDDGRRVRRLRAVVVVYSYRLITIDDLAALLGMPR